MAVEVGSKGVVVQEHKLGRNGVQEETVRISLKSGSLQILRVSL